MESKHSPALQAIILTSILLIVVGAVGLVLLFNLTIPTLGPRWVLFFLVTLMCSGIGLPFAYFINVRFPSNSPAQATILIREALFFGFYVDLLIWLQFGKVLNIAIAVFVLVGLGVIEFLLRWRERNRFMPGSEEDQA